VKVIRRAGARTVLDLYSGIGNFSLPLATAGLRVQGVETDPAAGAAPGQGREDLPRAAPRGVEEEDVRRRFKGLPGDILRPGAP
ncbi:hypothetical protein G3N55_12995, partial [Dissulfurirhabdus thermomarina]|nr:hypothetical protein [Dissulfurirhabdus thermomarina]